MKKILFALLLMLSSGYIMADEGMWMITHLSERTDSILHTMGLELNHDQIYCSDHASLNHAIVQFGGFCSGVVVSSEGLVFTNHHCGYGAIQDHSSPKHDYLENGFVAKRLKDELPNEGLYVDFHLNTFDVTRRMTANGRIDELDADSIAQRIQEELSHSARCIHAEVVPYYRGSKYYVSVYQRFNDVRLVFAPPQCLGKHGGDTDNWMWPRQTCDFSVFRIYANRNNQPADYSKDNVPYRPVQYAHVSLQGYQPGSFCMTFGYPGSTDRYLSSFGIENTMRTTNDIRIQVRDIKLGILKEAMNSSDALRIMYASKYASSSNYWKFSIGQNKALEDLGVIAEKKAMEKELVEWKPEMQTLLDSLQNSYKKTSEENYAMMLWQESFWSGSDILRFAMQQMIGAVRGNQKDFRKEVEKNFKDIDVDTDKRIFSALVKNYAEHVPDSNFLPPFYQVIDSLYAGNYEAYTDYVYSHTVFTKPEELAKIESLSQIGEQDAIFNTAIELITTLYMLYGPSKTDEYERQLGDAMREMNNDKEYYPDANFTLRMSFGMVNGYNDYTCFTPSQSIIDKYEKQGDNPDYTLTPSVYKWLKQGKWGQQYIDKSSGDLQLCFLTNNDITGGNSGSGMFDGKGRLIGLAFDGNWEAMSGDLKFDDRLQRCIGVDIRYVLSVIEKYGKSKRLIQELTLE